MDNHRVKVLVTQNRGRGVIAAASIGAGSLIARFEGEIYYWDWPSRPLPDDIFDHAIPFSDNYVRDSKGIARYLNHSCNPNCAIRELFDIVTLRPIQAGEELVWDYDTAQDDEVWSMDCKCGTPQCRKSIRGYRFLSEAQKSQCRPLVSGWILAKHREIKAQQVHSA